MHGSLLPQLNFCKGGESEEDPDAVFHFPDLEDSAVDTPLCLLNIFVPLLSQGMAQWWHLLFASNNFKAVPPCKMGCRPLVDTKILWWLVFVAAEPCEEDVRSAIQRLNGKVLPKLNWSAPKDAQWLLAGDFLDFQLLAV